MQVMVCVGEAFTCERLDSTPFTCERFAGPPSRCAAPRRLNMWLKRAHNITPRLAPGTLLLILPSTMIYYVVGSPPHMIRTLATFLTVQDQFCRGYQLASSGTPPRCHFGTWYSTLVLSRSLGSSRPCDTRRQHMISSLTTGMLHGFEESGSGIIVFLSLDQSCSDDNVPLVAEGTKVGVQSTEEKSITFRGFQARTVVSV